MTFTDRELRVLNELAQGKSTQGIAEALNIGYQTAKNYLRDLYIKTGRDNMLDLMLWWIDRAKVKVKCPCRECKIRDVEFKELIERIRLIDEQRAREREQPAA